MDLKIYKKLFQLCEKYQKEKCLAPIEYVSAYPQPLDEYVLFHFIHFQKHASILQEISEHFKMYYKIPIKMNMIRIQLLLYILIFAFSPENIEEIEEIFFNAGKVSHVKDLLMFYADEQNQIITAQIVSSYFTNSYNLKNFVQPILQNEEYFQKMYKSITDREKKMFYKKPTIPINTHLSKIPEKILKSKSTSEIFNFQSTKVPKTTFKPDANFNQKLQLQYKKNKEKALNLLEKARSMPNYIPKEKPLQIEKIGTFKKLKRILVKNDVSIKPNLTTVMREAALYAKVKETCVKEIDDILKGGVDKKLNRENVEKLRQAEEERLIQENEKKRLQCLLSYEDAIIAKCRLREKNKLKKRRLKLETQRLLNDLNKWRDQERNKYKIYIEKIQQCNKNVKESEKRVIEEKHYKAKLVQLETKELMDKAMAENEKELAKKMKIIQEIRAIRPHRMYKEYDKTERRDLGLLCEMSIAELEQKLCLMKKEYEKELTEKRAFINNKNDKKRKMVEEAKKFIEQNRSKTQELHRPVMELKENDDIKDLRRKLEEAKKLRERCRVCPCV